MSRQTSTTYPDPPRARKASRIQSAKSFFVTMCSANQLNLAPAGKWRLVQI
jgi:hypothetical protein